MPDLTKSASPAVKEAVRLYRELVKLQKTEERTAIQLASKLSTMDAADVLTYAEITSTIEKMS